MPPPVDISSAASTAASATPFGAILGGLGAVGGLVQSLIGSGQRKRALRALENLQTPTTESNRAISDYYNQALNPYSSLEYQLQKQNADASVAQGLTAAQDRRGGLASIGGLLRQRNNTLLRSAADAQSRLGNATQMKAADDQRVWNINKMMPYQKQYDILSAKAGGGANLMNAGLSNMFGGLNTGATSLLYNQMNKS